MQIWPAWPADPPHCPPMLHELALKLIFTIGIIYNWSGEFCVKCLDWMLIDHLNESEQIPMFEPPKTCHI